VKAILKASDHLEKSLTTSRLTRQTLETAEKDLTSSSEVNLFVKKRLSEKAAGN
jgi:hypothetical protein